MQYGVMQAGRGWVSGESPKDGKQGGQCALVGADPRQQLELSGPGPVCPAVQSDCTAVGNEIQHEVDAAVFHRHGAAQRQRDPVVGQGGEVPLCIWRAAKNTGTGWCLVESKSVEQGQEGWCLGRVDQRLGV